MLIDEADCVEHYGTRGMRWGVRKEVNRQHRALPLKDKVKSAFPSARAVVEVRKSHSNRREVIYLGSSRQN